MVASKQRESRKAKAKIYYILAVSYPLARYGWGELDERLEAELGDHAGAGTGFGNRYFDWWYDNKSARDAAKRKVLAWKLKHVKIRASEYKE